MRRLLLTFLPLAFLAGIVLSAVFGDEGLVKLFELRQQHREVDARVSELRLQNAELRRRLRVLDTRVGLRREAAVELRLGPPGARLHRFVEARP